MTEIGRLIQADGQYEYRDPGRNLIIRGAHPEWVLQAAGEVICNTSKLEAESQVEELTALLEFEAAQQIDVDAAKFALKERFEMIPQCIVSMGTMDYKWAAAEGRAMKPDEFGRLLIKRVHDMSLTRSGSFLVNEPGVDMSN